MKKELAIAFKEVLNAAIGGGTMCGVKRFSTICSVNIPKVSPAVTRW